VQFKDSSPDKYDRARQFNYGAYDPDDPDAPTKTDPHVYMMPRQEVFTRIRRSGHLPILPEILLRLLEACDDEATPLTEVASLIDKDPSLSFKVLQLVNSAYFGLRTTYSGIDQAVVYLGASSVKNMAVTAAVHQVFDQKRLAGLKHFNLHAFWYHSLKCAILSRRLAELSSLASPDDAYLGGLLHDLGKLVLASSFAEQYESILVQSEDNGSGPETEKETIGADHCEVGAWLIRHWKLSSLLADAIGYHHEPLEKICQALPLVKIVYLANLLSKDEELEAGASEVEQIIPGLTAEELAQISQGANDEIVQISSELGIPVQVPPDLSGETVLADGAREDSQMTLSSRIKGISLLSGFLENVVQAEDNERMLQAFERSMQVLFGIDQVVVLLPDRDRVLLCGMTSEFNKLNALSRELVLPVQKNSSRIVRAYLDGTFDTLRVDHDSANLADRQVLSALNCSEVALIPLTADHTEVGLVLLGLPASSTEMSRNDFRLIRTIAQQVGLCLHMGELKRRKAEDLEAERQAAISMTARKFAHEVNNPLGIINNYLTSLKLKASENDGINQDLSIISEEIGRISTMIRQLDIFGQPAQPQIETCDINRVIGDIVQLVQSSLAGDAAPSITFAPDEALAPVQSAPDSIKQVVINLLKNAAEALSGERSGAVMVKTGLESDAQSSTLPRVIIEVSDNGPGLPERVRANLYKPFISTKGGAHSGLGLSIVKKTVQELDGTISCVSGAQGGTTFTISLPTVYD